MNTETWALIIFTILAQTAVGAFLVLGVVHFFAARTVSVEQADKLSNRALVAIGAVLVLGLIASLMHLGQPLYAYRAILNFGKSWLSREIGSGVLFAALGFAFTLVQWKKWGSPSLRNALAIVAALAGVALVYSMSQVYMTQAQIAWNTLATPISFFATTVLLGSLALGAAFVSNYLMMDKKEAPESQQVQRDLLRASIKWIALTGIVVLGIELIVAMLNTAYLVSIQGVGELDFLGDFGPLFAIRLALGFIGAGVFGLFIYHTALTPGREKLMGTLALSAFAIILVGELLGRFLFYATEINVGL